MTILSLIVFSPRFVPSRPLMHQSIETTAPRPPGHSGECNICTMLHFKLFPAPRGKLGCYNTHPYGRGVSLVDFPKLVFIINNRDGSLTNATASSQSPLISVLDGKNLGMGMKEEGIKRSRYSV